MSYLALNAALARTTVLALAISAFMALLSPSAFAQGDGLIARWQEQAARRALEGTWRASMGNATLELVLRENGTFRLDQTEGGYSLDGNRITFTNSVTATYQWQLTDAGLTLSGEPLRAPITLVRAARVPGYFSWIFDVSPEALKLRFHRILVIVGIVLAARLLIALLHAGSSFLIFSERGPLRFIYTYHKNRARTLHSVILNLIKYFIYFTALGMALAELGINYTTYIASLSVVGLAVGFGSQGLVQDMVTGFFVIFEGQFDVGDMVEISGQTGYVTELGLRMTKIRNYLGQVVVIPNRTIATVANYSRGAQRGYIDVAIQKLEQADRAIAVLQTFGREIQRQYDGVVLDPIRVSGPMALETGEVFIRLHFSIWPNQLWVVDQQMVPRIRERIKAAGIEIPSDRVVPFYHAKEIIPVPQWRERLSQIRERFERRNDSSNPE